MPRARLGWNVAYLLAIIAVAGSMCIVARLWIVMPYEWLRPVSGFSLIRPVVHVSPFADVEQPTKCSGVRCAASGLRRRGIASPEPLLPQGPSRSVGIMCLYYGSTSDQIDGWLSTITLVDEGLVYMCDL